MTSQEIKHENPEKWFLGLHDTASKIYHRYPSFILLSYTVPVVVAKKVSEPPDVIKVRKEENTCWKLELNNQIKDKTSIESNSSMMAPHPTLVTIESYSFGRISVQVIN